MSGWPRLTERIEGEGIHRRHMKLVDGWRDTAWYSVIAPDGPDVRASLCGRLARHCAGAYR
jgi:hypothetical protein